METTSRKRVLCVNMEMHYKNQHAILSYTHLDLTRIESPADLEKFDLSQFDCVFSPATPIDVSKYPNTRFIFGPHFSIFPDDRLNMIRSPNTSYISLSKWVKNLWSSFPISHGIHFADIPFGVDTAKFKPKKPIRERTKVFIYYKRRDPRELQMIEFFLKARNIEYRIFGYMQKYPEEEYVDYLRESKYAIWLSAHESQGFALQEALSSNVPLLVWSVRSMQQEHGFHYPDIPATTITYWDSRCGEAFHHAQEFAPSFQRFMQNLENYSPREYVLENLSMAVCEKRFIDLIEKKYK
jgi:hypothetical protein